MERYSRHITKNHGHIISLIRLSGGKFNVLSKSAVQTSSIRRILQSDTELNSADGFQDFSSVVNDNEYDNLDTKNTCSHTEFTDEFTSSSSSEEAYSSDSSDSSDDSENDEDENLKDDEFKSMDEPLYCGAPLTLGERTADIPARSSMLNMKQHLSCFGCLICKIKTKPVKKVHIYPYVKKLKLRTTKETIDDGKRAV
ncbi:hypothetical protein HCN44_000447 [Aphidius gifuensis]|uniref:Uncharacterized protein n=1 Tax=Aphidius gifuensis TaxID=684658 RepID=A0A834XQ87_APHGI|nr:hypothetical protein HCN44_000447 [Aphidius gifuensis]